MLQVGRHRFEPGIDFYAFYIVAKRPRIVQSVYATINMGQDIRDLRTSISKLELRIDKLESRINNLSDRLWIWILFICIVFSILVHFLMRFL